jgi:hypothetical protein
MCVKNEYSRVMVLKVQFPGPAAAGSPGNLLQIQTFDPHTRPAKSDLWNGAYQIVL